MTRDLTFACLLLIALCVAALADEPAAEVRTLPPTLSGPAVPQSIAGVLPEKFEFSFSQPISEVSLAPTEDFRAEPTHYEIITVLRQRRLLEDEPNRPTVIDLQDDPRPHTLRWLLALAR